MSPNTPKPLKHPAHMLLSFDDRSFELPPTLKQLKEDEEEANIDLDVINSMESTLTELPLPKPKPTVIYANGRGRGRPRGGMSASYSNMANNLVRTSLPPPGMLAGLMRQSDSMLPHGITMHLMGK